jgi:hypothetical protein
MADSVSMELESRPGRVVVRFTRGDDTVEYPVGPDDAERLADNIEAAAERARDLS